MTIVLTMVSEKYSISMMMLIILAVTLREMRGRKMLTRKHFKALAEILREHKADGVLVRDVADFCYNSNSNFDRARFYHACELEL